MDRKPDVDKILRKLGIWGRYQMVQLVMVVADLIPCAFHLLSVVFIGYRPEYRCKDLENMTVLADHGVNVTGIESLNLDYNKCNIDIYSNGTANNTLLGSVSCVAGYEYSTFKELSFVTEWDLVCGKQELAELTQTLIILGQGVGAASITTFADKYGRKPVHIISHIFIFVLGLATAFSPNFYVLAPLRFLTGMAQQGVVLTSAILNIERFPMETRGFMEPMGLFGWASGGMLIPLVSYIFRHVSWRYIQITLSVWSAYSLIQYWTIDESLRWLVANGKTKEAIKIVKKACRWNSVRFNTLLEECNLDENLLVKISGKDVGESSLNGSPPKDDTEPQHDATRSLLAKHDDTVTDFNKQQSKSEEKTSINIERYTILDILKSKRLLLNSLILWYAWIVDSLSYYGLFIISSSLAGDRFVNFFLSALVEIPAVFVLVALINRVGRKKTSISFHALTGVILLIGTAVMATANGNTSALIAATALSTIGKFGATGAFSAEFCYTPELYPTNLRNAGIGIASALSRLGGMMSPFARTLAAYVIWGPGLIFGIMCLLVTVLMTFLPETRGHELPDSLEELKAWYKSKSKRKKYNSKDINIELHDGHPIKTEL